MKVLEKLTIYFAQWAFPPKENTVVSALKEHVAFQLKTLEPALNAIKPDSQGRTWRVTYHPIYKPFARRRLSNQVSLSVVIARHSPSENVALATLMRSGRPLTWRGYKRSDILSRAFVLNAHPSRQNHGSPALILDHAKLVDGRISRKDGHGVHAFLPEIEAHVRSVSNLVAWQGFPYDARRALLLATGQTRGRKHQI